METYEEDDRSPSNILSAIMRYRLQLALAIPTLLVFAVGIVLLIPPVYRSTGTIMVETQQIPASLVQSTVTNAASEQIDIITQRVLTREKILDIIRSHAFFNFDEDNLIEQSNLLDYFRSNVEIEVTSANSGREQVAIGFSVSYDSDSPSVAKIIASELTELFLSENVKARTERASETTEFLSTEADKMRIMLQQIEGQVAEFKRINKDSLPEHLNLYVGMREDTRRILGGINESLASADDQIKLLQNQLALARESGSAGSGSQEELMALRDEYRRLSLQYQPNYPDLVNLKQKIALLESGVRIGDVVATETEAQRNIRNQITVLMDKRSFLLEEQKMASAKLEDLEQRLIRIPQVEREFTEINRNYLTIQEQYASLRAKAQSAAMAESLEQQEKAERFTLLEPPVLPATAYKPDRKKLLIVAIVLSIGLPAGIVVLMGILDKTIRSSEALAAVVGIQPLAEIPFIHTQFELAAKRKHMMYGAATLVGVAIFGMAAINFLVMPLDVFAGKVVTRFGV